MSEPTVNTTTDGSGANKRKREDDSAGPDPQRLATSSSHNGSNGNIQGPYDGHGLPNASPELSNIDQQILQHVGSQNGISDDNALTAKAALAAHPSQNKYPPPPDAGFDSTANLTHGLTFGDEMNQVNQVNQASMAPPSHGPSSTAAAVYAAREAQSMNSKPTVGSPEWHALRKNNHKEVERRRRETINEGINQIAQLVPNCDKNKGAILQRAIEYIVQLHEEKKQMNTRWEQTNMTTTHAINEISAQNAKLKAEVNRRGDIALKWIQRCRDAGLEFDDYDDEKDLGQLDIEHNQ
ncbi:hypothetical protein VTN77DRAFT_2925 [Rasamsonia byssochlamydoides]|uniref:uncharacterized protein n=1 Tax=Rasamsonia byssochlamydoides TaxID=89139 RepID=UPI003743815A